MNFKELKNSAKNTVYGRREPFALAMILYIFLCLILMTPFTIFCIETKDVSAESIPIFSLIIFYFVFLVFVAIIPPLFTMAYIKTIRQLDLSKNSEAPQKITFRSFLDNIKDFFYGIGNFWWTYLWLYLWALATLLPFALISTICMAPSIRSGEDLNIFVFIILIILYFALLSVIINRTIAYSMNWFVLAENSKIGPIEAIKKSKLLTK